MARQSTIQESSSKLAKLLQESMIDGTYEEYAKEGWVSADVLKGELQCQKNTARKYLELAVKKGIVEKKEAWVVSKSKKTRVRTFLYRGKQ